MQWIPGTPLMEFSGVFPLLAEEQQELSGEALAIRWISVICEALGVLHRNGLVHGDVSPKNMIVSGSNVVPHRLRFCKQGWRAHGCPRHNLILLSFAHWKTLLR